MWRSEMNISIYYADWDYLREYDERAFIAVTFKGNNCRDKHPKGYNLVHEEIGSFDDMTDQEILSDYFERFNIGDRGKKWVRSMSVGDQVQIDDRTWVCKPIGWERFNEY